MTESVLHKAHFDEDLNWRMGQFHEVSRHLFNMYFLAKKPYDDSVNPWDMRDSFREVEKVLFDALVTRPLRLSGTVYGNVQAEIEVNMCSDDIPIMINREVNSGYWDFPIKNVRDGARLQFIRFFDWSDIDRHDGRFILLSILDWPGVDLKGKQALVESDQVTYALARA